MTNIPGTSGNNTLVGTGDSDIINRDGDPPGFPGTRGNDFLFGFSGADFIYGGPDNDQLFGGSGNDQLFGGTGNDLLKGGLNNDLLNGGLGTDTADYSTVSVDPPGSVGPILTTGASSGVTVNLNLAGAQNTGGAGIDTLVSIENLTGTSFNDTLIGNSANNVLNGLGNHDQLFGNGGNDILLGGAGNDILNGGAGSDTADYSSATAGVTVGIDNSEFGNEGEPQNTGGAGIDTLFDIENLIGSKFNDNLWGYEFGGTLDGGDGNDQLFVSDSAARLNGGAGNDQLEISEFIGFFDGTSTLTGGAGADRLTDSSFDHLNYTTSFDYNAVSDSPAGAGRDTIVGFHGEGTSQGDQIDLRDIYPGTLIWGGQWTAGHVRYVGGVVQVNTDSDAAAEFEIQLVGTPALFVQAGHPGTDILL